MSFFGKFLKTTLDVALLPVEIAKDVVTMGGAMTERAEPYAATKLKQLGQDIEDVREEAGKL